MPSTALTRRATKADLLEENAALRRRLADLPSETTVERWKSAERVAFTFGEWIAWDVQCDPFAHAEAREALIAAWHQWREAMKEHVRDAARGGDEASHANRPSR